MLVGRKEEISTLKRLAEADQSAFVALYGRRRVGKTHLIRQLFEKQFSFYVTGMSNAHTSKQLDNFQTAFVKYFPQHEDNAAPSDWFRAFVQLENALEALPTGKKIIFLDELPWMDSRNSGFISALEHFWNSWASGRNDVLLIVCGSAASWMINNLINNHGGLHNRVTHQMPIEPFTLPEVEAYFHAKNAVYDRYQLLQLYMVLGGVPFYLEKVDISKSAAQNINDLFFKPKSPFLVEFKNLYASLFKQSDKHIAVIETLAKKAKGMEREELIAAAGLQNNGNTTRILRELEESDFIRRYNTYGKMSRNALYQLVDFFSYFICDLSKKTEATIPTSG